MDVKDEKFLTELFVSICQHAKANRHKPDDFLREVAEYIEVATFNYYGENETNEVTISGS